MTERPLYSVGTWDTEAQAYTPQNGLTVPSINVDLWTLKRALKELRKGGYTAHYIRSYTGNHEDNDWAVLVERTEGMSKDEILESWKR